MKRETQNKTKYIRLAAIIAIAGNAVLAALKVVVGQLSKSTALVADGIDSSSDVLISIITLIIVAIISKPADKQHPWGHRRAETIATAFLSFLIFFMGAQLIINSVQSLISGKNNETPTTIAMIIASVSIVGKVLLAISQYALGKRADSVMLKANARNMASDVLVSVGVLLGLIISTLTDSVLADRILTILIGLWIIKTAIGIFRETNLELMDGSGDTKTYGIIVEAVDSIEGASNPHRARMRKIAGFWDISFDINVSPDCSISEAHFIATQVEEAIKMKHDNVFDIMVHVEPSGDDAKEAFGLSEEDMRLDNKVVETTDSGSLG